MFSALLNLPFTRSCQESKLPICFELISSNVAVFEYMSPKSWSNSEVQGGVLGRVDDTDPTCALSFSFSAAKSDASGGASAARRSASPRACALAETASVTR